MNTLRGGEPGLPGDGDGVDRAAMLRAAMIAELWEIGALRSDRVAAALGVVPRHLFAPNVPLEQAYAATTSVITKQDSRGVAVSSVSAPELQAFMLEQAEIRAGMNVLEIGSGGYNAALLAELVGGDGTVTTVDIDPEVADRARRLLGEAGYGRVNVVLADAEQGMPEHAPYDRIVVTVGAWDVPPAWVDQLGDGGRIVVPLRMRGLTRSLALEREGGRLVARSAMVCGFVQIQGAGANEERRLGLRGDAVCLRFDDGGPDAERLADGVLDCERAEVWSAVTIGRAESFDTLQFWLATVLPGFCLLSVASGDGADLVDTGNRWFNLAALDGGSFAYLVSRPVADGTVEFGAHGYGAHARGIADAMVEQVGVWDRERRHGLGPDFAVWPKGTPDEALPDGLVIDKRHSRIAISWPPAVHAAAGQDTQPTSDEQGE